MHPMRTFIAVDLPTAVQEEIGGLQRSLETFLRAQQLSHLVRWTPAEKIHLTLRFLGDTSATQSVAIQQALAALSRDHSPFDLRVTDLGVFPTWRKPAVVWLGLEGMVTHLVALQRAVEEAAQRAGFPAEPKAFKPHLTIGRVQRQAGTSDRQKLGTALEELTHSAPLLQDKENAVHVDGMVHMHSVLRPDGAQYTPLAHFSLRSGAPSEP